MAGPDYAYIQILNITKSLVSAPDSEVNIEPLIPRLKQDLHKEWETNEKAEYDYMMYEDFDPKRECYMSHAKLYERYGEKDREYVLREFIYDFTGSHLIYYFISHDFESSSQLKRKIYDKLRPLFIRALELEA